VIAEELSPATIEALGPDFDVRSVDGTDRSALLEAVSSAAAILVRSATQVDAEVIAAAPELKVIARAGVGLDNVDIKTATTAGVMVVNAPTSNIISAAELTIGHILSLARFIPAAHAALAKGELAPGAVEFTAGKLGKMKVEGDNVILGKPFVFTKENIDQFDF
jgi:D-3-phosphoglycerate dehydrogenase